MAKIKTAGSKALTNRINARASTGPRTPEGKAASSRNALKHGAYSIALLPLGESPEDLEALRAAVVTSLAPVGPIECLLVDRLVLQWWRLERAQRVERETLEGNLAMARFRGSGLSPLLADGCGRPVPRLEVETPAQVAFHWEGGTRIERLLRYETQVERAVFRLLHELEHLQRKRAEGPSMSSAHWEVLEPRPELGFVSAESSA